MRTTVRIELKLSEAERREIDRLISVAGVARRSTAMRVWRGDLKVSKVGTHVRDSFGLHSRQAESIRIDIHSQRASWRESLVASMSELGRSLAFHERNAHQSDFALTEARADHAKLGPGAGPSDRIAKLKHALFASRSERDRCQAGLARIKALLEADKPRVCFGGADLLRERSRIDPNLDAAAYADWRDRWASARDRQMQIVGSSDEKLGNTSCSLDPATVELAIRLPLTPGPEGHGERRNKPRDLLKIKCVVMPERARRDYEAALREGRAIHMRLVRIKPAGGDEAFELHVGFELDGAPSCAIPDGCLGVHIAADGIGWAGVSRDGNDLSAVRRNQSRKGSGPTSDWRALRGSRRWSAAPTREAVAQIVAELCQIAAEHRLSIALPGESYQAHLRTSPDASRRPRATQWDAASFQAIYAAFRRKAEELGLNITQVDLGDAVASGPLKYGRQNRMTDDVAIAFAIGRKAVLGRPKNSKPRSKAKRRDGQSQYFERVAFPKPMPNLEPTCIKGRPRGVAWKALLASRLSGSAGGGNALATHGAGLAQHLSRRGVKAAPRAREGEGADPALPSASGSLEPMA